MAGKRQPGVVVRPPDVEADWDTKIAKAKEIREDTRKARKGKPMGVYRPRFIHHPAS